MLSKTKESKKDLKENFLYEGGGKYAINNDDEDEEIDRSQSFY